MNKEINWAIVNHLESGIVNDGQGQKQIYRTKELAKEKCEELGYGTKVIEVEIKEGEENGEGY